MTFVMFYIYFTFIFTFILPLDTLSKHINTDPALLLPLLLSCSQAWGWVSQIRLYIARTVAMKSGVTPVCHSFSCMLFSFLRSGMLFVFVFSRMLFAFLAYCMLRIPVCLYAICFSHSLPTVCFLLYYVTICSPRGKKKPLVRRRDLSSVVLHRCFHRCIFYCISYCGIIPLSYVLLPVFLS